MHVYACSDDTCLALVYTVYIYAGGLSVACVYMWRYILRDEYVEHS